MSLQYNKAIAKTGRQPDPSYIKTGGDFKEFLKAIDHVGGVLLPEWRSTIRLGGHTFKKMKELGESSGIPVPEIVLIEKWARDRRQRGPEPLKLKEEPVAENFLTTSSSSSPSSTSSTSSSSSTPTEEKKGEGEGSSLHSNFQSFLSSDPSIYTLFPSLSACIREMKEGAGAGEEGEIFEILEVDSRCGDTGGK
jgi:hypothetical protein